MRNQLNKYRNDMKCEILRKKRVKLKVERREGVCKCAGICTLYTINQNNAPKH